MESDDSWCMSSGSCSLFLPPCFTDPTACRVQSLSARSVRGENPFDKIMHTKKCITEHILNEGLFLIRRFHDLFFRRKRHNNYLRLTDSILINYLYELRDETVTGSHGITIVMARLSWLQLKQFLKMYYACITLAGAKRWKLNFFSPYKKLEVLNQHLSRRFNSCSAQGHLKFSPRVRWKTRGRTVSAVGGQSPRCSDVPDLKQMDSCKE